MEYLKKLVRSKSFWAGIVQIVTGVGLYFTGEQSATELLVGAGGILTIVFRLITTQSIGSK